jgi:hypothetical protein
VFDDVEEAAEIGRRGLFSSLRAPNVVFGGISFVSVRPLLVRTGEALFGEKR